MAEEPSLIDLEDIPISGEVRKKEIPALKIISICSSYMIQLVLLSATGSIAVYAATTPGIYPRLLYGLQISLITSFIMKKIFKCSGINIKANLMAIFGMMAFDILLMALYGALSIYDAIEDNPIGKKTPTIIILIFGFSINLMLILVS